MALAVGLIVAEIRTLLGVARTEFAFGLIVLTDLVNAEALARAVLPRY